MVVDVVEVEAEEVVATDEVPRPPSRPTVPPLIGTYAILSTTSSASDCHPRPLGHACALIT